MPVDVSDPTESGAAEGLEAAADLLLELLDRDECELSVALVEDAAMRMLNLDWRGKDQATDVLSFPQLDDLDEAGEAGGPCAPRGRGGGAPAAHDHDDEIVHLGDVVISIDTARRQARKGGWTLEEELNRLLLHGVLHLLGYDHEQGGEEERRMKGEEARLAAALVEHGHPCAREAEPTC